MMNNEIKKNLAEAVRMIMYNKLRKLKTAKKKT